MTERDLIAIEHEFDRALGEANVNALDQILTSDWTLLDITGGVITKEPFLEALKSGDLKFISIVPDEIQVRIYIDSAVVTGRTEMNVRYMGQELTVQSRFTHVYQKSEGAWRMVAAQGTPIQQQ
jgi:ketosteroid isomerase-like protein